MSITTKTGDAGRTKLMYGAGVSKTDARIEACGAIDEYNAFLGLARSLCDDAELGDIIETLQRETFIIGAELATPADKLEKLKERVSVEMTAALESRAAEIEKLPNLLDDWSLPGATQFGAAIDVARVVARRAERCVVRLHEAGEVPNDEVLRYMNRLSDVLWLLGRRYEIERRVDSRLRIEQA